MPIFRKRPVEVEAEQFLIGKPLPFANRGPYVCFDGEFYVITVHGQRTSIALGDWIILETHGDPSQFQAYPCKPDVFEASYEPSAPPEGVQHIGVDMGTGKDWTAEKLIQLCNCGKPCYRTKDGVLLDECRDCLPF